MIGYDVPRTADRIGIQCAKTAARAAVTRVRLWYRELCAPRVPLARTRKEADTTARGPELLSRSDKITCARSGTMTSGMAVDPTHMIYDCGMHGACG